MIIHIAFYGVDVTMPFIHRDLGWVSVVLWGSNA